MYCSSDQDQTESWWFVVGDVDGAGGGGLALDLVWVDSSPKVRRCYSSRSLGVHNIVDDGVVMNGKLLLVAVVQQAPILVLVSARRGSHVRSTFRHTGTLREHRGRRPQRRSSARVVVGNFNLSTGVESHDTFELTMEISNEVSQCAEAFL